jgi:hypothetical protein
LANAATSLPPRPSPVPPRNWLVLGPMVRRSPETRRFAEIIAPGYVILLR